MTTATQTRQEVLVSFLAANAGRTLTLDEISEGTGIPRSSVSYHCSTARTAGHPLVNPLPGMWGIPAEAAEAVPAPTVATIAPEAPADDDEADDDEADDDEADDDEADDDEADDEAGNNPVFKVMISQLVASAMRRFTAQLGLQQVTMMLVGQDRDGNMVVVNGDHKAFRLVEL